MKWNNSKNKIMTVVSTKEFNTNIYHDASVYDEVLAPDDDFRRAITMDEFIDRALVMVEKVDKMYTKK